MVESTLGPQKGTVVMDRFIDEAARILASPMSRRQAFSRLWKLAAGVAVAGAIAAPASAQRGKACTTNAQCTTNQKCCGGTCQSGTGACCGGVICGNNTCCQ